jgi:hypothetical protein
MMDDDSRCDRIYERRREDIGEEEKKEEMRMIVITM